MAYIFSYCDANNIYHELKISDSRDKRAEQEDRLIDNLKDFCRRSPGFARRVEKMIFDLNAENDITKANFSLESLNEDSKRKAGL